MEKFTALLVAVTLCLFGSLNGVPETADHGTHAQKHKALHFKDGKHNSAYDLDALLGTQQHEELADLDDEVRLNRLRALAKSHDTNKNGMIEHQELLDWITHSFKLLDHLEVQETFKDEDDDNDGKISFEEVLKKRYGYTKEDFENLEKKTTSEVFDDDDKEIHGMVDEDKRRFAKADTNSDGFLEGEEFVAFNQPHDHPHMHEFEMERAMKESDKNRDGVIDKSEYTGAIEDEEERLSQETNFDNLDKDKDGKLSVEEFKPWVILDNTEMAKDEVEHLIRECDVNEDGHLSIDEIVEKEDEFISSQATDYGRHLHFVKEEL